MGLRISQKTFLFDPTLCSRPYKQGDNHAMLLQDLSDEQLMRAYLVGDAAAFGVLYARHEAPLFRFVRRVLGSALVAHSDEVFQDCWLRIIQAGSSYAESSGRWKTWAYTIAHHLCLDRLRLSGREISMDTLTRDDNDTPDWLQPTLVADQPGPADQAHWRAAGQQLLQCLDALPAAQRAAFLLHHEDGHSIEDMAHALGLSFETAKSRLRYALQKLRGCMQVYLQSWSPA